MTDERNDDYTRPQADQPPADQAQANQARANQAQGYQPQGTQAQGTGAQGTPAQGSAGYDAGQAQRRNYTEEFRVSGEAVLSKIKELVHEGNVRRITIKNDDGRTLIEIPLTLGVIGTVLLPVWAAIGAIAAMAANRRRRAPACRRRD